MTRFNRNKTRIHAFTLLELAAVVTISAGAMALMVPTLSDARKDARLQKCLSNMGQIGKSMLQYRSDLGQLPLFAITDNGWAPWTFGGWSGRNREFWESTFYEWNPQTNERYLTVYMTPWQIPSEVDRFTPTQEAPLFKCPSDSISHEWQWGEFPAQAGLSAYDDVGTSYIQNWLWWEQVLDDHSNAPWSTLTPFVLNIFEKYIEQAPSRFIMLMEEPANYGFGIGESSGSSGIQIQGYHGEFAKHVTGQADGSAMYRYIDSRHLHESFHNPPGPRHGSLEITGEWTVCDQTKTHPSGGRHL